MKVIIWILFYFILLQENGKVQGQPWVPAPGNVPNWMEIHEYFVSFAETYSELINVAFWGDSLTAGWDPEIFTREFSQYGATNFAIGGDKIENNLYRMIYGNLEPLKSRMAVLMIGGNNFYWGGDANTHDEIVYGIFNLLATIHNYLPGTKILLLGMIPSHLGPDIWDKTIAINSDLAAMANNQSVYYLGMWDQFLINSPGYGFVDLEIFPDGVHLGKEGYEIYANALRPTFEFVWSEASKTENILK